MESKGLKIIILKETLI